MAFNADQIGLAVRARLAASRLDRALATGSDPAGDLLLARRAAQLSSRRVRRQLVGGLERLCATPAAATLSAAPCDREALEIGQPALAQLAAMIRSRELVEPRGIALTIVLLTEPASPLYQPVYPEQVYEAARDALFALRPEPVAPTEQPARTPVALGESG